MAVRAAVIDGPRSLRVEEVALRPPGAGEVVIEISACGICGSNLHSWAEPDVAYQAGGSGAPGATGHEISGVVAELGAGVRGLDVGQPVCVEPNLASACGQCAACMAGRAWFCRDRAALPVWGFAERMVVRAAGAIRRAEQLPPDVATLAEPLACAVHAIRHSWTTVRSGGRLDGRRVAVLGAGASGLLTLAAARFLGAASVVVSARYPHQAELAARFGADAVVGVDDTATLRGFGPELVIEAVGGTAPTVDVAMRAAAPGGEVVVLGLFDQPQRVDLRRATFRELRLFTPVTYGIVHGAHDLDVALAILAGFDVPFADLVTHRFRLAAVDEAFAAAADKRTGSVKVVVQP